jgi:hypothetical protein
METTYGDHGIESILATLSICPTERQEQYIFAKYNEIQFGPQNVDAMWEFIDSYCINNDTAYSGQGGHLSFQRPVKKGS